jgi:hypothetical protein
MILKPFLEFAARSLASIPLPTRTIAGVILKSATSEVSAGKRLDDAGTRAKPLYPDIYWNILVVALTFHHELLHVRIDRDVRDRDRIE